MPLVNAKCSNCGAILTVDDNKEAAICDFCGSAYIVEKAVQNFKIQNQYNINAGVVNIINNPEGASVKTEKAVVDDEAPECVCSTAYIFRGHNKFPNKVLPQIVIKRTLIIYKSFIKLTNEVGFFELDMIRYSDIEQLLPTRKNADKCLNLTMKNGKNYTICMVDNSRSGDRADVCRNAIEKNWKMVKEIK